MMGAGIMERSGEGAGWDSKAVSEHHDEEEEQQEEVEVEKDQDNKKEEVKKQGKSKELPSRAQRATRTRGEIVNEV